MSTNLAATRPSQHFHVNVQALGIFIAATATPVLFGVRYFNFVARVKIMAHGLSGLLAAIVAVIGGWPGLRRRHRQCAPATVASPAETAREETTASIGSALGE